MSIAVEPLLSIIATCRNDNYGGNMLDRFHFFIRSVDRFDAIPIEIIIVEWNPQKEKETMTDVIGKMRDAKKFRHPIRVITVSKEQHEEFLTRMQLRYDMLGMPAFDFQEYPAKNVGIRNAKGKYILITNPDNYFPMKIIKEIEELCGNGFLERYYKGARRGRAPEVIHFTANPELRSNMTAMDVALEKYTEFDVGCNGDFILISSANMIKIRGFLEYPFCWTHFEIPFQLQFQYHFLNGMTAPEYTRLMEKQFGYQYADTIRNMHYHFNHYGSGNTAAKSGKSAERSILHRLGDISFDMKPPAKFPIENEDDWGMAYLKKVEQLIQ